LVIVAFCFSMTIGVCWEFIEFTCDHLFGLDMQKDTIVHMISSTKLNPNGQKPVKIYHIHQVIVNGKDLGLGGYLDIGLIDTMKDLFVNFIGALVFSFIGFFALHGRKKSMEISEKFIIHRKGEETDYLAQMKDQQKVQEALGRMDEEAGVDEKLESRKKRLEEWESRLLAWEKQLELNDLEAAKALKKSLHSDENAASSGLSDVPEDGEKPLTAEFEKPLQSEKSLQKEKDINGKKS
ncbi:MAG: hypothetical protein PUC44_02480, partial [Eubacteriales bacterium]|nr:hypothetical protein [Eubacteriales bacterium]